MDRTNFQGYLHEAIYNMKIESDESDELSQDEVQGENERNKSNFISYVDKNGTTSRSDADESSITGSPKRRRPFLKGNKISFTNFSSGFPHYLERKLSFHGRRRNSDSVLKRSVSSRDFSAKDRVRSYFSNIQSCENVQLESNSNPGTGPETNVFHGLKRALTVGSVVANWNRSFRQRVLTGTQSFRNMDKHKLFTTTRPTAPRARMSTSDLRSHKELLQSGRYRSRGLSNIDPKFISQSGLCTSSELETSKGSIRIQHLTAGQSSNLPTPKEGVARFPRLQDCAHFHYEFTEIGPIQLELVDRDEELRSVNPSVDPGDSWLISVQVTSKGRTWIVRRSYENFVLLDKQSHQCIYDRRYSQLPEIVEEENLPISNGRSHEDSVRQLLSGYLCRFSSLAGPVITCGPVLNWFELDNRGHRLIVTDDGAINTPAVAAAYVVKRYTKQAPDEISFEVGDMISVIDMPPPDESIWWRGKRGFEVGFFPGECVEVIGDKVPRGLNIPLNSNGDSGGDSGLDNDSADSPSSGDSSSESHPTKPVLRKHGKLISFFRSFILSRPARGKLKKSGILKERVFGCDLSEHLLNTGQEVPRVLTHCAEFIEERGIIDGIYRLSGIASNIQKLRVAFDEDRVPNLHDDRGVMQDIHSVSSLLKMYFRELPNPICTYHLYEKFVEAAKAKENQRLVLLRDVVQQLPPPNYRTLEYLSRHLYRVSLRGGDTGMTAKNVAIVWAPNLLRSKSLEVGGVAALQGVGVQAVVTEYLIRYCELIFSDKMPVYHSITSSPTPKKQLRPKSLAISTPTKLLSLEEARNRALSSAGNSVATAAGLIPIVHQDCQRYIEVGGGPEKLPQKYHTVIDLPGRKAGGSIKYHRRSPIAWKNIFSGKNKVKTGGPRKLDLDDIQPSDIEIVGNRQVQTLLSQHHQQKLRPVRSAESLIQQASLNGLDLVVPEPLKELSPDSSHGSRPISMDLDELGPLEIVQRAVAQAGSARNSPKTHSRSSSHDSYFERKLSVQFKSGDDIELLSPVEGQKTDSNLDLSEIQMNFELEDNEMKIFSEDEATMLSNSIGSDLNKSPLDEYKQFGSSALKRSPRILEGSDEDSPKARKMSFREKFKRFTSPTPNRKLSEEFQPGEIPKKSHTSLKDKIVGALSPESLRKKAMVESHSSSASFPMMDASPHGQPSGTEVAETSSHGLPLSPSINFIDASMHESLEKKTDDENHEDVHGQDSPDEDGLEDLTDDLDTASTEAKTNPELSIIPNPRLSMASSANEDVASMSSATSQAQNDQLVIAQIHHVPIIEEDIQSHELFQPTIDRSHDAQEESQELSESTERTTSELRVSPTVSGHQESGDESILISSPSLRNPHLKTVQDSIETLQSLVQDEGRLRSLSPPNTIPDEEETFIIEERVTETFDPSENEAPEKEDPFAHEEGPILISSMKGEMVHFDYSDCPMDVDKANESVEYDESVVSGPISMPATKGKVKVVDSDSGSSHEPSPGSTPRTSSSDSLPSPKPSESKSSSLKSSLSASRLLEMSAPVVYESKTSTHLVRHVPFADRKTESPPGSPAKGLSPTHKMSWVGPTPYSKPSERRQSASSETSDEAMLEMRSPNPDPIIGRSISLSPPVPMPRNICKPPTPKFDIIANDIPLDTLESPIEEEEEEKALSLPVVPMDETDIVPVTPEKRVRKSPDRRRLQFSEPAPEKPKFTSKSKSVDKISLRTRLSTTSLHTQIEEVHPLNEEPPLQRRNSIHNVPFVDVSDPQTRERMERYKEERRSLLRAKYKVEDYKTKKISLEEKPDSPTIHEVETPKPKMRKSVSSPPLTLSSPPLTPSTPVEPRPHVEMRKKKSPMEAPKPKERSFLLSSKANGDEEVNVKERAAIFGVSKTRENKLKTVSVVNPNPKSGQIMRQERRQSLDKSGTPSKIKNMAAMFEQQG